jgi:hypothetical protein
LGFLWPVCVRCRCRVAVSRNRVLIATADWLFARMLPWTERGCGLFADMNRSRLRPVLCLLVFADVPRL